jgi:hypothetical protein
MLTNRKIVIFLKLGRVRETEERSSLVLSSNQRGREITSPEQALSDTVKIINCYVLGAEIKIKCRQNYA